MIPNVFEVGFMNGVMEKKVSIFESEVTFIGIRPNHIIGLIIDRDRGVDHLRVEVRESTARGRFQVPSSIH